MAINFPASPTINQQYSFGGRTWKWSGVAWNIVANTLIASDIPNLDASKITTGTFPIDRLPVGNTTNSVLTRANADTLYMNLTGDQTIDGVKTFSSDVSVNGDLYVQGTTFSVNATNLDIADNVVMVAKNNPGGAFTNAGLGVERGSSGNDAFAVFNENLDAWCFGTAVNGSTGAGWTYIPVLGSRFVSDVTTGTSPLSVVSTTMVSNLNAELLGGQNGAYYRNASNINAGTISDSYLPTSLGAKTFTATTIFNAGWGASTGASQIYLNGTGGNRIDWGATGVAAPAFTTRSAGTKLVLYPQVTASTVDYAIGIETNTLWNSVPNSTTQFKWYAGTNTLLTLLGNGSMTFGQANQIVDFNKASLNNTNGVTVSTLGPANGVVWSAGNGWAIYESPDNLTSAAGNLQFVQGSTRRLTLDTSGNLYAGSNVVWHAGNDGAGSGLDADLFDGQDSNKFGRLVATTANGGTTTTDGANTWAKIATYSNPGQFQEQNYIYAITSSDGASGSNAMLSVMVRSNATGTNPSFSVSIMGIGGAGGVLADDSFKIIANDQNLNWELWIKKVVTYCSFSIYEVSARASSGTSVTYATNSAWTNTVPTGTVLNSQSGGFRYKGNIVWHSGNQGASSGLDSDLLDGQHGTYYTNASTINAGTLGDNYLSSNVPLLTANNAYSGLNTFSNFTSITYSNGVQGSDVLRLNPNNYGVGQPGLAFRKSANTAWTIGLWDGSSSSGTIAFSATSLTLNGTNLMTTATSLSASQLPAHTGDVTSSAGSAALTLATVNSNVGTYGTTTTVPTITVNAKGLITAVSNTTVTPAWSSITSKPTTLAGYGITDAQPLDGTLTALAAASWSSGTQVLSLTGNDVITLKTVGSGFGNLLDRAAGDALYLGISNTATNANALNGQSASYYTNASNLVSGTVPNAVLNGTYSAVQRMLVADGLQASPSLGFASSPNSGFYLGAAGLVNMTIGGSTILGFNSSGIYGNGGNSFYVLNRNSTGTVPTIVQNRAETNTGIGGLAGKVSLIANSVETFTVSSTGATYFVPIANANLVGNPTAPTISNTADNTTSIATTAFVQSALANTTFASNSSGFDSGPWDPSDSYLFAQKALDEIVTGNWSFAGNTATFTSNVTMGNVSINNLTIANANVWHSGNDGLGSGLDADLLDGQQGSFYQNASNINTGTLAGARMPALSGDIASFAGNTTVLLNNVNSNVGTFGSSTSTPVITVNAKGLITAVSISTVTPSWSSITSKPNTLSGYGITDAATSSHKYHQFGNGQYYYDSYANDRYFRLFIETAYSDTVRFCPVTNPEYYNYGSSTWVNFSSSLANIQNLLMGREENSWALTHTNRTFRFEVDKNTGWCLTALAILQIGWTAISYPGCTITLENYVSNAWVLKDTLVFTSANGFNDWGVFTKVTSGLHDGVNKTRVTIDFNDWTDNGGYTTLPLKRFMILSGYSGSSINPWTWDYSRSVKFLNIPNVNGVSVMLTNTSVTSSQLPALTGDISTSAGSSTTTLATVNSNVGTYGNATTIPSLTVNDKGLITAVSTQAITPDWSSITGAPTTISGYGLTDAVTIDTTQTISGSKTFSANTTLSNAFITGNTRFQNNLNVDAGKSLYFGREELLGGIDTGGADYGWIIWDNDNNTYAISNSSSENGTLRIGCGNDGTGANEDSIAITPSGSLYVESLNGGGFYYGNAATRQTIWHAGNDGAGTGLDADLVDGVQLNTFAGYARMSSVMTGGGTISYNSSKILNWSSRLIVLASGGQAGIASGRYFDISVPASGTVITGLGGAANVTTTASGIPMTGWSTLYYIVPVGSTATNPANFRIVAHSSDYDIPYNWVAIASYNQDNNSIRFANGLHLQPGDSYNTAVNSSAYAANAALLGGQAAAYYTNASTINAGTIADTYLPATMSSKTFGGNILTSTTNTYDIGTSSVKFRNIYAGNAIVDYGVIANGLSIGNPSTAATTINAKGGLTTSMRLESSSGGFAGFQLHDGNAGNAWAAGHEFGKTSNAAFVFSYGTLGSEVVKASISPTGDLIATGNVSAVNGIFSGDITVTGNVSVMGSTFTVNSVNLDVADSIITVGKNNSSAALPYLGLKAERGSADAFWVFEESNDTWSAYLSTDELASNRVLSNIAAATGVFGTSINSNAIRDTSGNNRLTWSTGANADITTYGALKFQTDNTWDVGTSAANRPRDVWVGRDMNASGHVGGGASSLLYFSTRSRLRSPSDGNLTLLNLAETGFGLLQFGGTSASFAAIKNDSGAIRIRTADDTADAQFKAGTSIFSGAMSITANVVSNSTSTGSLIVTGGVGISGALNAATKSFVIPHPTKKGMTLRHGSLEGPEYGVYVRGKTTSKVIEMPDYWIGLVDEETITVSLTAIGCVQNLYVEKIEDNKVYVNSVNEEIEYFYTVYGERKDVAKLEVEI